jgi:hypothetical protein
MSRPMYLDYWAGLVSEARMHRRIFPNITDVFQTDPEPPANYSPEKIDFALKLVAYWEGGPPPDSPEAVPVRLNEEFPQKP